MAYDSKRLLTVMFGGTSSFSGSPVFGDTWEYDGVPARRVNYGIGCASTTALPTISSTKTPRLGHQFPISVNGFLPTPQVGQLLIGGSDSIWGTIPLPLV